MLTAFAAPSAAVLAVTVLFVTLSSIGCAVIRMGRRPKPFLRDVDRVPVTIVRPVCGLEAFSEETLGSAFRLHHPAYEIVFCAASSADPVIPLVQRLIAAHPDVPARLLVGDDRVSANPKLNNCVKGWKAARHDWIVLADSNVLMPRDYLRRILSAWRPDTGVVCSTPAGTRPRNFWAEVECAFLNTMQARWQYAGEALGMGFAQGKSMLWYRPFLDGRGGIGALSAEIAEDAAATKLVREAGLRVHLVDRPFEQPLGDRSAAEVWARQLRWARLRRVTFPLWFAPEILSSPVLPVALAAFGAAAAGMPPALAAGALVAAWWGAESVMARSLGWHLSWRSPAAFAVRDLLIPALWAAAFLTQTVVWRGNSMEIRMGDADSVETGPARA